MDVSCKVSLQLLSRNSLKVLLFSNCTKRWINIYIKKTYCYGDRGAVVPGEVFIWLMLLITESRNRMKPSVTGYMLFKHFDLLHFDTLTSSLCARVFTFMKNLLSVNKMDIFSQQFSVLGFWAGYLTHAPASCYERLAHCHSSYMSLLADWHVAEKPPKRLRANYLTSQIFFFFSTFFEI